MTGNHPTLIPFASGRLTADLGHRIVYANDGGYRRLTPARFHVLDLLVQHLDEVVSIDDLIDETAPGLTSGPDRFMQRTRVGRYVAGLRKTFDQLVPGTGHIELGVLQTEFGQGFWLSEYWHPASGQNVATQTMSETK